MQASIHLRALSAVSLVASIEATRYYLCGVLVEVAAGHVTYVATDGHRLVAHREEMDKGEENTLLGNFIIPLETCRAIKLKKFESPIATLTKMDGSEMMLASIMGKTIFSPVEGSFPDWRRVMPKKVNDKPSSYNATYLASLEKVAEVLHPHTHKDSNRAALTYVTQNGNGVGLVEFPSTGTVGLIMPIRRPVAVIKEPPAWVGACGQSAVEDDAEVAAAAA